MKREHEGVWQFSAHEIVKHSPLYYDAEGRYTRDEWTSRSDVNKMFNRNIFTIEEYMEVERKYVNAVKELMNITGSSYLTIFIWIVIINQQQSTC